MQVSIFKYCPKNYVSTFAILFSITNSNIALRNDSVWFRSTSVFISCLPHVWHRAFRKYLLTGLTQKSKIENSSHLKKYVTYSSIFIYLTQLADIYKGRSILLAHFLLISFERSHLCRKCRRRWRNRLTRNKIPRSKRVLINFGRVQLPKEQYLIWQYKYGGWRPKW